jgi:hypothetical protein
VSALQSVRGHGVHGMCTGYVSDTPERCCTGPGRLVEGGGRVHMYSTARGASRLERARYCRASDSCSEFREKYRYIMISWRLCCYVWIIINRAVFYVYMSTCYFFSNHRLNADTGKGGSCEWGGVRGGGRIYGVQSVHQWVINEECKGERIKGRVYLGNTECDRIDWTKQVLTKLETVIRLPEKDNLTRTYDGGSCSESIEVLHTAAAPLAARANGAVPAAPFARAACVRRSGMRKRMDSCRTRYVRMTTILETYITGLRTFLKKGVSCSGSIGALHTAGVPPASRPNVYAFGRDACVRRTGMVGRVETCRTRILSRATIDWRGLYGNFSLDDTTVGRGGIKHCYWGGEGVVGGLRGGGEVTIQNGGY